MITFSSVVDTHCLNLRKDNRHSGHLRAYVDVIHINDFSLTLLWLVFHWWFRDVFWLSKFTKLGYLAPIVTFQIDRGLEDVALRYVRWCHWYC